MFSRYKKKQQETDTQLSISLKVDRFLSKPLYRKGLDTITIIFFILVIIGPIANIY